MPMFKIEAEDDRGLWTDVRGDDGKVLTFDFGGRRARRAGASAFPCSCRWKSTPAESARASSGSSRTKTIGRGAPGSIAKAAQRLPKPNAS